MGSEVCVRSFKVQDTEPRLGSGSGVGQASDQGLAFPTTLCSKTEPKKSKNSLDFQIFQVTYLPKEKDRYISFNL